MNVSVVYRGENPKIVDPTPSVSEAQKDFIRLCLANGVTRFMIPEEKVVVDLEQDEQGNVTMVVYDLKTVVAP